MIAEYIRKDFIEYLHLNKSTMDTGLYESLSKHERAPKFFRELERAIYIIQMRNKVKLNRLKIKNIVYDFTKLFVSNVKQYADLNSKSILERIRLENEAQSKLPISDETAKEYAEELSHHGILVNGEL